MYKYIFFSLIITFTGCGSKPEWILVHETPILLHYVDVSSLGKEGALVKMTTRTIYNKPYTTPKLPKEHWSLVMTVLINCNEKSWVTIKYATFDKEDGVVESGSGAPTYFYSVPNWIYRLQNICDHVMDGKPINLEVNS